MSSSDVDSSGSGSSSTLSTVATDVRKSFSSAITFLIDARMSSIDGSRPPDCITGDIAYWRGGVTPDVVVVVVVVVTGTTGGEGSMRAVSIWGVTIGVAGISSGATVRVAIVGCR